MLVEKSLEEFVEALKSDSPTPGGGGVAALNSALGAAQIMMVANHTIGKERYAEYEEECQAALTELDELRADFLAGIDADAEAFGKVAEAYQMPNNNEAEKEERDIQIANASLMAASAPLSIMQSSIRAMEICASMMGRSNPNLESDLKVAALSLQAGLKSAKLNVDANMSGLRKKDPELATATAFLASELLVQCDELMGKIL